MTTKQFPPSVKRLSRARREGKVVKSRMVSVAAGWIVLLALIGATFTWVRSGTLIQWLNYKVWQPHEAFAQGMREGLSVVCVAVAALACSGFLAGLAQTKGLLLPSQLARGFQQYQLGAYLGRVRQGACDAFLGLVRCVVVGVFVLPGVLTVFEIEPITIIQRSLATPELLASCMSAVLIRGAVALVVIAAVSYSLVRWRFLRQLRMSLQELKDEYKEDEGDPHAKAARKQEHRALLLSEVEKRVQSAKVILVRRLDERIQGKRV
jgi:flagellar biosynthesis protein FlhB